MEKRLVLFMFLSMSIIVGYSMLREATMPPKPVAEQGEGEPGQGEDEKNPADAGDKKGDDKKGDDKKGDDKKGDDKKGDGEKGDGEKGDDKKGDGEKGDGATDPPPAASDPPALNAQPTAQAGPEVPAAWPVLGQYSGESASSAPLLVTFSNQGAGVVRLELVERQGNSRFKYRELDAGGYLGITALDRHSQGGCRVLAVAPGGPAEAAGLQTDDVLLQIDDQELLFASDLAYYLEQRQPGEEKPLTWRRGDATQTAVVTLATRPLELIRPETDSVASPQGNPPSFRLWLASLNGRAIESDDPLLKAMQSSAWQSTIDEDGLGVVFRFEVASGTLERFGADGALTIVKRFRLATNEESEESEPSGRAYHLEMAVEFERRGEPLDLIYEMEGPNGLTTEGWWYQNKIHPRMFRAAGARDVICFNEKRGSVLRSTQDIATHARKNPDAPVSPLFTADSPEQQRTLRYIGVDTQYFVVAMLPEPGDSNFTLRYAEPRLLQSVDEVPRARMKTANVTFRFQSEKLAVGEAGQVQNFRVFAGPKRPELLRDFGLEAAIEYGWFPWVAKPLGGLLHLLYALVRNYGLAIILLTVLVRWAMLPLGRKAARNAQMMQVLAPELNKIKEKHKGDSQKMMQAQQELYRKHNFNPLSGCLPMFIQLPIFLGLYRCLSVDIELRQAAMIPGANWCSNLAGPDQFFQWKEYVFAALGSETGWLGPYLNILPIVTIALFLIQQKMFTPPAQDEQQKMQQQIMTFMMVFIGVMFFKVPAGLCLYFITSSLWGIGERKLLPPPPAPGAALATSSDSGRPQPSAKSQEARDRAKQRRKSRR